MNKQERKPLLKMFKTTAVILYKQLLQEVVFVGTPKITPKMSYTITNQCSGNSQWLFLTVHFLEKH